MDTLNTNQDDDNNNIHGNYDDNNNNDSDKNNNNTIKNRIKNNRNDNSHPRGFGPPGRCLVMDEKDEMLELLVVVMEGVVALYGE